MYRPPLPSPIFTEGRAGSVHRLNVTRQCRCSYFELGQPVVQRPVFDSRQRFFSLFWLFCLCHCFFVLFYHIYFVAMGWFQCFHISDTFCSSAGCCDKRLIPNIETGLICYQKLGCLCYLQDMLNYTITSLFSKPIG